MNTITHGFRKIAVFGAMIALVSNQARAAEKIMLATGSGQKVSVFDKLESQFEKETGIKIEMLSKDGMGGTNVILAVDTGKAEVGILAGDVELTMEAVEKSGNALKNKDKFKFFKCGKETTHFITHPALGKKEISADELAKILSGDVNNWKEIGGPDLKIQFAYPAKFTSAQAMVVKYITKGKPLRAGTKFMSSFDEILDFVVKTPGAIALGGAAILSPKVAQPTHPPMDRYLWFMTVGEPTPKARKFLQAVQKLNGIQ